MCQDTGAKNVGAEYITIHSDYSKLPKNKIMEQIVSDLEHSKRELYSDDFPPLYIVNNLVDINVEFDANLARTFYLRMSDCFAEDEAWVICREFPSLDEDGFNLPCDYRDAIYNALGLGEDIRPTSGCPYCPYETYLDKKCCFRYNYSPKRKIFYVNEVASLARDKFDVENPTEEQYNYIARSFEEFHPSWKVNLTWLTYKTSRLVWKKAYELLAYWPLRRGVKVKER